MPRKQKRQQKKSWLRRHFWHTFFAIMTLCGIGAWLYISNASNPEITRMKLETTAPTEQTFYDTNNAIFASDSGTPEINNNRTLNQNSSLIISYRWESGPYAPAFTMGINKNDLNKYIKISPFIRGNFELVGSNSIKFTPDAPWPADTRFTIRMSKKLFDTNVRPDDYSATITTPEIAATLDSFNTYHDKSNPQSMIAVAIL